MCACLHSAKTYSPTPTSHSLTHSLTHSHTCSQANDRIVDIAVDSGCEDGVDTMNLKLLSTRLGNEAVSEYQAHSLRHNSQQ